MNDEKDKLEKDINDKYQEEIKAWGVYYFQN
jgi:hypothetical protein